MAAPVSYVHIGDMILLEVEDGGRVLGSTGVSSEASQVAAFDSAALQQHGELAAKAVLVIQPQGTWTHLQAFKSIIERQGLSMLEGQVHAGTRGQYKKCMRGWSDVGRPLPDLPIEQYMACLAIVDENTLFLTGGLRNGIENNETYVYR